MNKLNILNGNFIKIYVAKVGCVFPMVVVSILPHASLNEFGSNCHREDAPHIIDVQPIHKIFQSTKKCC